MHYYCTYFDWHYLPRGLALYQSLRQHSMPFHLWIICLDQRSLTWLARANLMYVTLIPLDTIECTEPALATVRGIRTRLEYYFTLTPIIIRTVLNCAPEIDLLTYLDADIFLFANPQSLFYAMEKQAIGIVPQRFPASNDESYLYGRYNVGWISFRRGEASIACLNSWRQECLEWCYLRCEDGRFGDQKYLDTWFERFSDVVILDHPGADLAPWNVAGHCIAYSGGQVTVDKQPLIFYHFHGIIQIRPWLYYATIYYNAEKQMPALLDGVYKPYLRILIQVNPERGLSYGLSRNLSGQATLQPPLPQRLYRISHRIVKRHYFYVINGHVFR